MAENVNQRRLIAGLLTAALAAAGAGCGAAASSPAVRQGPTEQTVLQDQIHVLADPDQTLDVLRSLGVTEVRLSLYWDQFASDPSSRRAPARFDAGDPAAYPAALWAPYDAAIRAAAARGMGVYLLLTGPAPLWATTLAPKGTATHNAGVYEPSATDYGQFVKAVGTRYDGTYTPAGSTAALPKVRFFGIWDEPNYGQDLAPEAVGGVEVAPRLYRGLLDDAWSALQATGHGGDTIVIGETAPRGANIPGVANGMVPLRFLHALYCVNSSYQELRGQAAAARGCPATAVASGRFRAEHPALFDATGFAAHLYTPGQVAPPSLQSPANETDNAGLADLANLDRALDRLTAVYGSTRHLPIYNTEFGFQTDPPKSNCDCVFLSPATAAYYLNWSEYIEWSDPRIRSNAQYLLYDAPSALPALPSESSFSSGLLFLSGAPKADYAAYRLPLYLPVTAGRRGRALEVWGQVRPAPYVDRDGGSAPRVAIQFQPRSRGPWTTVRTVSVANEAGYFEVPVRFSGTGSVRLEWTYPPSFAFLPAGTPRTATSRIQRITLS